MNNRVGRATHGAIDDDCVLECLPRQNVRNPEVIADHFDNPAARSVCLTTVRADRFRYGDAPPIADPPIMVRTIESGFSPETLYCQDRRRMVIGFEIGVKVRIDAVRQN